MSLALDAKPTDNQVQADFMSVRDDGTADMISYVLQSDDEVTVAQFHLAYPGANGTSEDGLRHVLGMTREMLATIASGSVAPTPTLVPLEGQ